MLARENSPALTITITATTLNGITGVHSFSYHIKHVHLVTIGTNYKWCSHMHATVFTLKLQITIIIITYILQATYCKRDHLEYTELSHIERLIFMLNDLSTGLIIVSSTSSTRGNNTRHSCQTEALRSRAQRRQATIVLCRRVYVHQQANEHHETVCVARCFQVL